MHIRFSAVKWRTANFNPPDRLPYPKFFSDVGQSGRHFNTSRHSGMVFPFTLEDMIVEKNVSSYGKVFKEGAGVGKACDA